MLIDCKARTVVRVRIRRVVVRIRIRNTAIRIRVVVRTEHHTGAGESPPFALWAVEGKLRSPSHHAYRLFWLGYANIPASLNSLTLFAHWIVPLKARREP